MSNATFNVEENNSYNNIYINANSLIKILEQEVNMRFENLKQIIKSSDTIITEDEILLFLGETFWEENPELYRRIENQKKSHVKENVFNWTAIEKKNTSNKLSEFLRSCKYELEPSTLKYFKDHINTLEQKCINLLDIIEKISNNDTEAVQSILSDLDISLNENGNIKYVDTIRLINPVAYNINTLLDILSKVNSHSTYLTIEKSEAKALVKQLHECTLYPSNSLQIKEHFLINIRKICWIYLILLLIIFLNQENLLEKKLIKKYILNLQRYYQAKRVTNLMK
jgi:hypothetical protein